MPLALLFMIVSNCFGFICRMPFRRGTEQYSVVIWLLFNSFPPVLAGPKPYDVQRTAHLCVCLPSFFFQWNPPSLGYVNCKTRDWRLLEWRREKKNESEIVVELINEISVSTAEKQSTTGTAKPESGTAGIPTTKRFDHIAWNICAKNSTEWHHRTEASKVERW